MKAITYHAYGGVEKLQYEDIEQPKIKADEVLIKVHAVSINDFDLGMLQGSPFILKFQNGLKMPRKTQVLGSDIAGVVEAVGEEVTRFKVGDKVFGDLSNRWGGFAEYCCANEKDIEAMGDTLSFEEAAALPQAGALAYQGLFDYGHAKQGERILINGAGGGVGTLGAQMGLQAGLRLDGVDTVPKLDQMKAIGFESVSDFKRTDFIESGEQYDIVLDNKMNRSVRRCLKALQSKGRYLVIGGDSFKLMQVMLFGPLIKLMTGKEIRLVVLKRNQGLAQLKELHASGKLKIVMDIYPFSQGIKAIEAYSSNQFTGKVVISMNE